MTMKNLLALTVIAFMMSCGSPKFEQFDQQKEDPLGPQNRSEDSSQLSFRLVKAEILDKNCIRCHSSYSDYDKVFKDKDSILASVLSNSMPPSGKLSDDLKQTLQTWVEAGAPERNESATIDDSRKEPVATPAPPMKDIGDKNPEERR